jgi:putative ABC transport system permease protein
LLSGHAKPVEEDEVASVTQPNDVSSASHHPQSDDQHDEATHEEPLPIEQREVTAILLRTVDPIVTSGLRNTINEGPVAQAVLPIAEIYQLFANFVNPIKTVLLILTAMICVVSGVSILVSIYNSMSDRRHEIAVMRALGAGRHTVMLVVLFESVILSLGGGLGGWIIGHILIGGVASPVIEERTGVTIGLLDFAPPLQFESALAGQTISTGVSTEMLLIPALIVLAIIVGFLPALAAYRTDVARALSAKP